MNTLQLPLTADDLNPPEVLAAVRGKGKRKRHKYGVTSSAAERQCDGYQFDSLAEMRHYGELALRQAAGEISKLEVHPRFAIADAFTDATGKRWKALIYIADFAYIENGREVVVDVKGVVTPVFRIKERLFRQRYPQVEFLVLSVSKRKGRKKS